MRAFKAERELEVWATDRRGDPFTHVTTYKICAASGVAGPKKAEGDGQVPEGFYTINLFNPRSSYHLSMRVSYPNRRDRALRYTGSAIMIHGDCVSIGCLAMSDERIEELWVMNKALPEGERADVHLFPGRDLAGMIERARPRDPELAAFWTTLKRGNDAFEANHQLPVIRVKDGAYTVE
ncbi:MAG: L,D-transpeptidase family protein [Myxococcales bacterium]|nr:L,D-transpeptidase family protein [Myxococcales bacterium]MCB9752469.1 L,D-transpeptidase family protein [Myxococcales bacterium]